MLSIFWNLGIFIITSSIFITIHELGHFLVAKYYSVKVECFSIGFGKELWKYRNQYGTEFIISIILLGGYVKMLDERIKFVPPALRCYAINNKTISQRFAIIIAGPLANFIFATLINWIVLVTGTSDIRPVVQEVIPNSIASNAKITSGMEIKAIDGIRTTNWNDVRLQLITKIGNQQTTFSVALPNSNRQQNKILNLHNWLFKPNKEDLIIALGICPYSIKIEPVLIQVQEKSIASKAGLQSGDRIVKINGHLLTNWTTFTNLACDNFSKPLILDIERGGSILSLKFILNHKQNCKKIESFIGVKPKTILCTDNNNRITYQFKPLNAILQSIAKTWQLIKIIIYVLGKLLTGDIKLNNLNGPISIAQEAGISARFGILHYLIFLAFININVGVVNLLPFPILDGGNLFFLAIERLKGKSVSKHVQSISHYISFVLLVLLMIFVLFNDFSRLRKN